MKLQNSLVILYGLIEYLISIESLLENIKFMTLKHSFFKYNLFSIFTKNYTKDLLFKNRAKQQGLKTLPHTTLSS